MTPTKTAPTTKPHTVWVAGSSEHTLACARALSADERFVVVGVLTPQPKPRGRKQLLEPNPLELWGRANNLPIELVDKKITAQTRAALEQRFEGAQAAPAHAATRAASQTAPDFLLVVDFGYLVPDWLLAWPSIAPINIHPSALPRWRGSSPGQFVLLYGEQQSAVSIMCMDAGLDTGPLLASLDFTVEKNWDQREYYAQAFKLAARALPTVLAKHAAGMQPAVAQPTDSPTPVARRLSKQDGYIAWELLVQLLEPNEATLPANLLPELLREAPKKQAACKNYAQLIVQATRALHPWPTVWTNILTTKGEKRMQIISARREGSQLVLETVKIAGQEAAQWNQVKNSIKKTA